MAYKKFIKRGGKTFGPYYYESYRDENGTVKKKYIGLVNPDAGKKKARSSQGIFSFFNFPRHQKVYPLVRAKKVTPTKNEISMRVFLVPMVILLALVFGFAIYSNVDSGIVIDESLESVGEFISDSFFKIAGFAVSEIEEIVSEPVAEEVPEEDSGGGGDEEIVEEEVSEPQEEISGGQGAVEDVETGLDEEEIVELVEEDLGGLVETEEINETLEDEPSIVELEENETEEILEVNETLETNETVIEEIELNETIVNETLINETIVEVNETLVNETSINETLINETVETNETIINETIVEINETLINETIVNETIIEVNETIVVNETLVAESVESLTTLQYKAVIERPVKWLKKVNVSIVGNLTIEIPKSAENVSVLTDEEVELAEQEIEDYEDLVEESEKVEIVSGLLTGNVVMDIESEKGFFSKLWEWFSSFTISGNVVLEDELEAGGEIVETAESKIVNVENIVNKTGAEEIGIEYYTPAPSAIERDFSGGKLVTVMADDEYNYTDILAYSLIEGRGIGINDSSLKVYWRASYTDAVRYGYIEGEVVVEDIVEGSDEVEGESEVPLVEVNVSINDSEELINLSVEVNESLVDVEINETELELGESVSFEVNVSGGENISEEVEETESLITGNVIQAGASNLTIVENESAEVYVRVLVNFSVHDLDGDGFADYVEWIVPHLSNQTYEISIDILNVQSYPTVGGNWTVRFNTTGEANLTVSAFNGTTYGLNYSNASSIYDLVFLELKCGDEIRNVSVMINETAVSYDIYLKKKRIEEIRRLLYG